MSDRCSLLYILSSPFNASHSHDFPLANLSPALAIPSHPLPPRPPRAIPFLHRRAVRDLVLHVLPRQRWLQPTRDLHYGTFHSLNHILLLPSQTRLTTRPFYLLASHPFRPHTASDPFHDRPLLYALAVTAHIPLHHHPAIHLLGRRTGRADLESLGPTGKQVRCLELGPRHRCGRLPGIQRPLRL